MGKKASRQLQEMKVANSLRPSKLSPLMCSAAQTKFSGSSLARVHLMIFSRWRFKPLTILVAVKILPEGETEDEIRTSSKQMPSRIHFPTRSLSTSLISLSTTDSPRICSATSGIKMLMSQGTEGEVAIETTVGALKGKHKTLCQHFTILLRALENLTECLTILRIWKDT